MARRCSVCGRRIRSGYKYCYEHRHTDRVNTYRGRNNVLHQNMMIFIVGGFASLLISYLMFKNRAKIPDDFNIIMYLLFGFGLVCFYLMFYTYYKKIDRGRNKINLSPGSFIGLGLFISAVGIVSRGLFINAGGGSLFPNVIIILGVLLLGFGIAKKIKLI